MRTALTYILVGLVVIMLGALVGWFIFLRQQTSDIQAASEARGFGSATPVGGFAQTGGTSATQGSAETRAARAPRLWRLSENPAAGTGFASTSEGVVVRFVERSSGHIFDANPETSAIARRSNELTPKIYGAKITGTGRIIMQTLDQGEGIDTHIATLQPATSTPETPITRTVLPNNIISIAPSPTNDQIFYLKKTPTGVLGVRISGTSTKETEQFSSRLPSWSAAYLSDGRVLLSQNPADSLAGYAFTLDAKGGLSRVLGNLPGLSVLQRADSRTLLYSTSQNGALTLYVQSSTSPERVAETTIAEKCVWAPGAALVAFCAVPQSLPRDYLDTWYRGETHTSDSIWRIDGATGQAERIYTPDGSLDIVQPTIDRMGSYMTFINARDNTPWVFRINNEL